MKTIQVETDRKVFGFEVKTFPDKIGDAFDSLMKKLPAGDQRSYFGISWMEGDLIRYYAAAELKTEGEASRYGARGFTLRKGDYLVEELTDWMPKVSAIKGIFETMMNDPRLDKTSPAVEWYKSDDVMWCMMRLT